MAGIKVVLDDGAYMPVRAHKADAGLDLRSPKDFIIEAGKAAIIDTGVHVEIPYGYVGMLKSKSGLNVRCGIVGEGTIDSGYTGSIVVKLYNLEDGSVAFRKGDKIIQLVVMPVCLDDVVLAEALDETERGDGGFGSTGR